MSHRAGTRLRALLVTGTDTGVGKTVVACGLGSALTARGHRVLAVKPVESGCAGVEPLEEDGARLAAATGQATPRAALNRLAAPLAPPLAADREGVELRPADWQAAALRLGAGGALLLIEGAGGLLSPLAWGHDARDLAAALGASALLVATDRLGVLNHCLLTREALRRARVPLLGVVLVAPAVADAATGGNAAALARCGFARLALLPRLADPARAADHLAPVVAWTEAWIYGAADPAPPRLPAPAAPPAGERG